MILYYGADRRLEKPLYNHGRSDNDYGSGFYLTNEKEKAYLWASQYDDGYVIKYNLNLKDLKILYLNTNKQEDVLLWISILVNNRFSKEKYQNYKQVIDWLNSNYNVNLDDYDVVVGYRADDSYFLYSEDFVANELSIEALSCAMKLGKLGLQYCLKSQKAFHKIETMEYIKVEHSNDYKIFREKIREEYRLTKKNDDINNTRILDIMRKTK